MYMYVYIYITVTSIGRTVPPVGRFKLCYSYVIPEDTMGVVML